MSDLLPLVAEVLKDKVLTDTQKEIAGLQDQVQTFRAVEVIQELDNGAGIVLAAGDFSRGSFRRNRHHWDIGLKGKNKCRLSDLQKCSVTVGGGFPVATLNCHEHGRPRSQVEIHFDEESDMIEVRFYFLPGKTWILGCIHGWPRGEWQPLVPLLTLQAQRSERLFLDTLGNHSCPEAWMEFHTVTFDVDRIPRAMKQLIPKDHLERAQADLAHQREMIHCLLGVHDDASSSSDAAVADLSD